MYVKKIKYQDFDGNEREDTFLFHLKKSEVMEWMMQEGDYTLDKVILKIIQKKKRERIDGFLQRFNLKILWRKIRRR